jgi:nucleoside-diphosphate-sugar epimerase
MRILVTGHLNYIGSVMVPMLLRPITVVGCDSNLYERCLQAGSGVSVPAFIKDVRDVSAQDLKVSTPSFARSSVKRSARSQSDVSQHQPSSERTPRESPKGRA